MSVVEPAPGAPGLIDRVKNIILTPTAEWTKIEPERPSAQSLYLGFIMPLAAIPVVAGAIGAIMFGYGGFGFTIRPNPVSVLVNSGVQYVLTLIGVFVMALIINALAETFGGKKDQDQALKVAAYSSTAGWLAGIFSVFPALAILGILGLYSVFLLYRGLPILMKAPRERAVGYTATVIVIAIVLGIVFVALSSCVAGMARFGGAAGAGLFGGAPAGEAKIEGKVDIPGGGSIDLGELEKAAKQLEAQSSAVASGEAGPVTNIAVDTLKAMLPETLPGGYARTEVSTASGGAAGFNGTTASATYTRGDSTMEVAIVDMGAAGALAAMASAFGVNATTENADGYEKVGTVDGRFTSEKLDRPGKTAEYTTIVAKRFVLSAQGTNVSVDDVKGAVNTVGINKLDALAKANPG